MFKKPSDKGIALNQCTIFESTPEKDKEWFDYFLCCKNQEFSFCSNVSKYQTVKDSTFNFLTTTPNNIKRLKMDMPDIEKASQREEEEKYQQFKEKYHDKLLCDFRPELKELLLRDKKFLDQIRNDPATKEAVIQMLYDGSLTETEHFEILELRKLIHSDLGRGKHQKPIDIVKKEKNNYA